MAGADMRGGPGGPRSRREWDLLWTHLSPVVYMGKKGKTKVKGKKEKLVLKMKLNLDRKKAVPDLK